MFYMLGKTKHMIGCTGVTRIYVKQKACYKKQIYFNKCGTLLTMRRILTVVRKSLNRPTQSFDMSPGKIS